MNTFAENVLKCRARAGALNALLTDNISNDNYTLANNNATVLKESLQMAAEFKSAYVAAAPGGRQYEAFKASGNDTFYLHIGNINKKSAETFKLFGWDVKVMEEQ